MQEAKKLRIRASLEPEHSFEIIVRDKIYLHSCDISRKQTVSSPHNEFSGHKKASKKQPINNFFTGFDGEW